MPSEPILTEFVASKVSPFTKKQIEEALDKFPNRFKQNESQFIRVAIDRLLTECGFETSEPLLEKRNNE